MQLLDRLARGEALVCDGAMGTMLIERGLKPGECPEQWNLERPEVLVDIARQYVDAGADIVETNTFGGSPLKLAQYGLEAQTEEINRLAIRAARQGASGQALIAASCGPTGRILIPYGDTEPGEVSAAFRRQFAALLGEGIDALVVETMTDLSEATLAVKAARELAPDLPVIATMTFDSTSRGFFTIMGVTVEQAARGLSDAGTDIVGSNCGNGIDNMVKIASEFRKHTHMPIIIQSNAGLPRFESGRAVYAETPEFMAAHVRNLLECGVSIIGGCCGTTPEHIAAIRRELDKIKPGKRP
ncbi:MAG: homocysteine S-methyltransferase family protein [Candidatus Zixiibacteriota bacterium]